MWQRWAVFGVMLMLALASLFPGAWSARAQAVPTLPPGMQAVYIVQPNDQLLTVARQFGVSVAAIKVANDLRSDRLVAGQVLLIPNRPATPTAPPNPQAIYTVQAGDQLLALARRFGVTTTDIILFNNLSNETLRAGQVLYIPFPRPAPTARPTSTPIPNGQGNYVVQPGDQLLRIARSYGVTLAALRAANNLTSNTIRVGQVLQIPPRTYQPYNITPTLAAGQTLYTVQANDTLTSISRQFKVSVESLRTLNRLTSDKLYVGQALIIPAPPNLPTYTVARGDTLTSIATQFGVTVEALSTTNYLRAPNIFPGQVLFIPAP